MNAAALELVQAGTYCPSVILTYTGKYFDFMRPDPAQIDIGDIAHALAHLNRYTGHTCHFYSVAQHSVLMAEEAHEDIALAVLLHDAAEAYLGDIATPLKQFLPEYKRIEDRVLAAIGLRFGCEFDEPITKGHTKELDWRMMATEVNKLMPARAEDWDVLTGIEPIDVQIWPWDPQFAKKRFLQTFQRFF